MPNEKRLIIKYAFISLFVGIILGYCIGSYFPLEKLFQVGSEKYVLAEKNIVERNEEKKDFAEMKTCDLKIEAAGAVSNPGVYCLPKESIVDDVVKMAGGVNKLGARRYISQRINLAQRIEDGQKIYIPFEDDMMCEPVKFTLDNSLDRYLSGEEKDDCVDINFATVKELDELPGIGQITAEKIAEGRPYKTVSDLKENKVVSDKVFGQIESIICL